MRLIGPDGEQIGIVQTRKALQMAEDANMDLVMVAPHEQPPVCKIVDYGKYKYEQKKLQKESRAKRKQQEVKGIKLKPGTAANDLQILLRKASSWLDEGHKVRFLVQHRAREVTHPEIGRGKLEWFIRELGDRAQIEKPIGLDGTQMTMVLSPAKRPSASSKAAEPQPETGQKVGSNDVETENKQDSSQAI